MILIDTDHTTFLKYLAAEPLLPYLARIPV